MSYSHLRGSFSRVCVCVCGGGGGGWGWGEGGGVNFGTGVRASISKPTPFIYLAFEKTVRFIYLIIRNVDLCIYCRLIICTHLLLVVRQHIAVNSFNTKRTSSHEKSGAFHIGIKKNLVIHILFVEKRGPIIYLAALKKGGHSACTSAICHI